MSGIVVFLICVVVVEFTLKPRFDREVTEHGTKIWLWYGDKDKRKSIRIL